MRVRIRRAADVDRESEILNMVKGDNIFHEKGRDPAYVSHITQSGF